MQPPPYPGVAQNAPPPRPVYSSALPPPPPFGVTAPPAQPHLQQVVMAPQPQYVVQQQVSPQQPQPQQQVIMQSPGSSLTMYPTQVTPPPVSYVFQPGATGQPQQTQLQTPPTGTLIPGSFPTGTPQHQFALPNSQSPGSSLTRPPPGFPFMPSMGIPGMPMGFPGMPAGAMPIPLMMPPGVVPGRSPGPSMSTSTTSRNSASTSSRTPINPKIWGYAIVDPLHPSLQRVPVPPSAVLPTAGVDQYNSDVAGSSVKPCSSAVCMKYANSKDNTCPLGEGCMSFHVNQEYLEKCRALPGPICCINSDDCFGQEMARAGTVAALTTGRYILVLDDKSEIEIVPGQLAITVGLEHLYVRANDVRVINLKKQVCRMHLEGKCKWTKDCGHVHICRDLVRYLGIFHYPSLHFLLMTDNDSQIEEKLKAPELIKFLSSHCARPLLEALVTAKKSKAISVLEGAGVVMPEVIEKVTQQEEEVVVQEEGVLEDGEVDSLHHPFSTFANDSDPKVETIRQDGSGNDCNSSQSIILISPRDDGATIGGTGGILSGILNANSSTNSVPGGLTPMLPLASENGTESL